MSNIYPLYQIKLMLLFYSAFPPLFWQIKAILFEFDWLSVAGMDYANLIKKISAIDKIKIMYFLILEAIIYSLILIKEISQNHLNSVAIVLDAFNIN